MSRDDANLHASGKGSSARAVPAVNAEIAPTATIKLTQCLIRKSDAPRVSDFAYAIIGASSAFGNMIATAFANGRKFEPMRVFDDDDEDPVKPSLIEHRIENVYGGADGKQLEQSYNFLDYHFELNGAYLRARAYLDEMQNVTLFGPFEGRGNLRKISAPEVETAVIAYLARRYSKVGRN